jgi:hypothetical protein
VLYTSCHSQRRLSQPDRQQQISSCCLVAAAAAAAAAALLLLPPRVPDELRKHYLSDGEGGQYSTNLDRNRYGNDDQYLFTGEADDDDDAGPTAPRAQL